MYASSLYLLRSSLSCSFYFDTVCWCSLLWKVISFLYLFPPPLLFYAFYQVLSRYKIQIKGKYWQARVVLVAFNYRWSIENIADRKKGYHNTLAYKRRTPTNFNPRSTLSCKHAEQINHRSTLSVIIFCGRHNIKIQTGRTLCFNKIPSSSVYLVSLSFFILYICNVNVILNQYFRSLLYIIHIESIGKMNENENKSSPTIKIYIYI